MQKIITNFFLIYEIYVIQFIKNMLDMFAVLKYHSNLTARYLVSTADMHESVK